MSELDEHILKFLRPPEGWVFEVEPIDEISDFDYETMSGPQFSMPRVVPPTSSERQRARDRHPSSQASDGGPGVKDHSIIKRMLREWL